MIKAKVRINRTEPDYKQEGYTRRRGAKVSKTLDRIKKLELSPHELKYYGLSERWKEEIPAKVLERLAKAIEKNKEALKELEKY
ncbi:MAG TPA: hypothetical protein EYP19_00800 [Desulfobacterales bacterium]|nr:hypothetical protein [Desulfobacterales bacterium]